VTEQDCNTPVVYIYYKKLNGPDSNGALQCRQLSEHLLTANVGHAHLYCTLFIPRKIITFSEKLHKDLYLSTPNKRYVLYKADNLLQT